MFSLKKTGSVYYLQSGRKTLLKLGSIVLKSFGFASPCCSFLAACSRVQNSFPLASKGNHYEWSNINLILLELFSNQFLLVSWHDAFCRYNAISKINLVEKFQCCFWKVLILSYEAISTCSIRSFSGLNSSKIQSSPIRRVRRKMSDFNQTKLFRYLIEKLDIRLQSIHSVFPTWLIFLQERKSKKHRIKRLRLSDNAIVIMKWWWR